MLHLYDWVVLTWFGKSAFSSAILLHQYAAVFSLISSMFRKEPWPGPYIGPEVIPRTILGETLVTISCKTVKPFRLGLQSEAYIYHVHISHTCTLTMSRNYNSRAVLEISKLLIRFSTSEEKNVCCVFEMVCQLSRKCQYGAPKNTIQNII